MAAGVGMEVAGYRLTSEIGGGGMAIVYRAEPTAGGPPAAVKIIRDELLDDAELRTRFIREARYATELEHPNLVEVLAAGEDHGDLYIAMAYVPGQDLRALLDKGPLAPAVAIAILAQVGSALDAAHAIGLLHRDVKPGNVLLEWTDGAIAPRCYLSDFGLSKHTVKDSVALTEAGRFVGTIAYTAPEQMIGPEPGAAADIYSLGCLLYECVAGELPFSGTELEMMQAHIETAPAKLSSKESYIPSALDAVFDQALAKEPTERFGTCAELIAAAAAALRVPVPGVFPPGGLGELAAPLELLVASGPAARARLVVEGELLLGSGADGPGSLGGDPELSPRHALVTRVAGGALLVEDLASESGTFAGTRRIFGPELVGPGGEFTLGSTVLTVVAGRAATVSVRLELDPDGDAARLFLDEASDPVEVVWRDGGWRLLARPGGH